MEEVTGQPADHWLAGPEQGRALLHADDAEEVADAYHRVIERWEGVQLDHRIRAGDGGLRWLRTVVDRGPRRRGRPRPPRYLISRPLPPEDVTPLIRPPVPAP